MVAALPVDIYVYVYGTLKKDFFNYDKYLKPAVALGKAEFVGAAQTAHPDFFLVLHKDPFVPGMYRAPADGYRVPGEVYKVDTDTLKALDILEGVADKWYQQEKIDVEILDGERKGETIVCGTYIMPARDDLLMLTHIPKYIGEYQEGCKTRANPPKLAILQCIYGKEKTDQVQMKIDGGLEFADAWKAVFRLAEFFLWLLTMMLGIVAAGHCYTQITHLQFGTMDANGIARIHEQFMREALSEGEKALTRGEVPVGAVFVYNGEIIARASNRTNELYNATKHAEVVAIEEIAAAYGDDATDVLANTTLYVTCEPCIMCASALAHVRIQQVYFGCHNDRFGGCSSVLSLHEKSSLPNSKLHVGFPSVSGILKDEAIILLRKFYESDNPRVEDSKKRRKKPAATTTSTTSISSEKADE